MIARGIEGGRGIYVGSQSLRYETTGKIGSWDIRTTAPGLGSRRKQMEFRSRVRAGLQGRRREQEEGTWQGIQSWVFGTDERIEMIGVDLAEVSLFAREISWEVRQLRLRWIPLRNWNLFDLAGGYGPNVVEFDECKVIRELRLKQ